MGKKLIKTKSSKYKIYSSLLAGKKDLKLGVNYNNEYANKLLKKLESYVYSNGNLVNEDIEICKKVNEFINSKLVPLSNNLRRRIIFDDLVLKKIVNNQTKSLTINEIRQKYMEFYTKPKFSNETLRRYMRKNLGYRYKQCYLKHNRSSQYEVTLMMINFITRYISILDEKHTIIFVDETSINDHRNTKKFWTQKNGPNVKLNYGRLSTISVTGAIDSSGLLHYELNKISNTADDFIMFISNTEKLLESHKNYSDQLSKGRITVILDNSKLHTSKKTRKNLKYSKLNFLYQPCYCPQVNGIEMIWGLIKRKLSKNIVKDKQQALENELKSFIKKDLSWVFKRIVKTMIKFLKEYINNNLN